MASSQHELITKAWKAGYIPSDVYKAYNTAPAGQKLATSITGPIQLGVREMANPSQRPRFMAPTTRQQTQQAKKSQRAPVRSSGRRPNAGTGRARTKGSAGRRTRTMTETRGAREKAPRPESRSKPLESRRSSARLKSVPTRSRTNPGGAESQPQEEAVRTAEKAGKGRPTRKQPQSKKRKNKTQTGTSKKRAQQRAKTAKKSARARQNSSEAALSRREEQAKGVSKARLRSAGPSKTPKGRKELFDGKRGGSKKSSTSGGKELFDGKRGSTKKSSTGTGKKELFDGKRGSTKSGSTSTGRELFGTRPDTRPDTNASAAAAPDNRAREAVTVKPTTDGSGKPGTINSSGRPKGVPRITPSNSKKPTSLGDLNKVTGEADSATQPKSGSGTVTDKKGKGGKATNIGKLDPTTGEATQPVFKGKGRTQTKLNNRAGIPGSQAPKWARAQLLKAGFAPEIIDKLPERGTKSRPGWRKLVVQSKNKKLRASQVARIENNMGTLSGKGADGRQTTAAEVQDRQARGGLKDNRAQQGRTTAASGGRASGKAGGTTGTSATKGVATGGATPTKFPEPTPRMMARAEKLKLGAGPGKPLTDTTFTKGQLQSLLNPPPDSRTPYSQLTKYQKDASKNYFEHRNPFTKGKEAGSLGPPGRAAAQRLSDGAALTPGRAASAGASNPTALGKRGAGLNANISKAGLLNNLNSQSPNAASVGQASPGGSAAAKAAATSPKGPRLGGVQTGTPAAPSSAATGNRPLNGGGPSMASSRPTPRGPMGPSAGGAAGGASAAPAQGGKNILQRFLGGKGGGIGVKGLKGFGLSALAGMGTDAIINQLDTNDTDSWLGGAFKSMAPWAAGGAVMGGPWGALGGAGLGLGAYLLGGGPDTTPDYTESLQREDMLEMRDILKSTGTDPALINQLSAQWTLGRKGLGEDASDDQLRALREQMFGIAPNIVGAVKPAPPISMETIMQASNMGTANIAPLIGGMAPEKQGDMLMSLQGLPLQMMAAAAPYQPQPHSLAQYMGGGAMGGGNMGMGGLDEATLSALAGL